DPVDEIIKAACIHAHEVAGAEPPIAVGEYIVQDLLLGVLAVGIAFKAFTALRGIAWNPPDRLAGLVHAAADAETVRVARRPSGRRLELHQRQWKARGEEGRNAADRADLAFYIVERHIAFGRRVEFQD